MQKVVQQSETFKFFSKVATINSWLWHRAWVSELALIYGVGTGRVKPQYRFKITDL